MFAIYDYSLYETNSIVNVKLNKNIENNEDFNTFLNKWRELYQNKKDFIFIFDTSNVGFIPIKYSIQMSLFIKKLRKEKHQYLQKSIIYVNNNIVKRMLDFIFMLQPPVAEVYIIDNKDYIELILNNNVDDNIIKKIITILPSKSFLNLL
ncbi:MAG: hypothetical protein CMD14_10205 [Flavobacteriales bacterium]|nr:hypothetical protein [Flavobacteriales bacterium]|tara:strand:- start:2740 stop:3189 length:450 start_codon:yes stop_codon:yes gene_type:complete